MKVREVIVYKHYFEEFFAAQPQKVRDKIIKVLDIIEQIERAVRLMNEYYKDKESNEL